MPRNESAQGVKTSTARPVGSGIIRAYMAVLWLVRTVNYEAQLTVAVGMTSPGRDGSSLLLRGK